VFYNETKIKEYSQYSKGEIVFKIKDIKKTDSLTVNYFRDSPCNGCETRVTIVNEEQFVITKGLGFGTLNPIKVSVYNLLLYHLKVNKDEFEVFYEEVQPTKSSVKFLIFKIKLE
jgi:hypothetical protein